MAIETVSFTPRLVTVFVEHERLMGDTISQASGLSTTDYCILRALYLMGGEASGVEFARFLLLKPNSVSAALSKMERRGMVMRFPDVNDARVTTTRVTDEGVAAVRGATSKTYQALKETFWRDFTDEEIVHAVNISRAVMGAFGSDMADVPAERAEGHTPLLPEFISGVKHIIQRWTATLSGQFGLALSEYRLLAATASSTEPLRASEAARLLFLAPSAVSVLKSGLGQRELLSTCGARGRGALMSCTQQGLSTCAEATQALSSATADCYAGLDENTVLYLDEWHTRMYRILMQSALLSR